MLCRYANIYTNNKMCIFNHNHVSIIIIKYYYCEGGGAVGMQIKVNQQKKNR